MHSYMSADISHILFSRIQRHLIAKDLTKVSLNLSVWKVYKCIFVWKIRCCFGMQVQTCKHVTNISSDGRNFKSKRFPTSSTGVIKSRVSIIARHKYCTISCALNARIRNHLTRKQATLQCQYLAHIDTIKYWVCHYKKKCFQEIFLEILMRFSLRHLEISLRRK